MADEADMANDHIEKMEERNIAAIRAAAAEIPEGLPGICDSCEEESGRLVFGFCAPCRDRFKLG